MSFTVIQSTAISILFHILLILFTSHIIMILWLLNFVAITLFKLCSSKVKVVDTNGNLNYVYSYIAVCVIYS